MMRRNEKVNVKKKGRVNCSPKRRGRPSCSPKRDRHDKKASPPKMQYPEIDKQPQFEPPLQSTTLVEEVSEAQLLSSEESYAEVQKRVLVTNRVNQQYQDQVGQRNLIRESPGMERQYQRKVPEVKGQLRRPQSSAASSTPIVVSSPSTQPSIAMPRPRTYGEVPGNVTTTRVTSRAQTLLSELTQQPRPKTPGTAAQHHALSALAPELPVPLKQSTLVDACTSPDEDVTPPKTPPPPQELPLPIHVIREDDNAAERTRRDSEFWYRRGVATGRDLRLGSAPSVRSSGYGRSKTKISRPKSSTDSPEKSNTERIQAISMGSTRREALRKQLTQWLKQDLRRKKMVESETNEPTIKCGRCQQ